MEDFKKEVYEELEGVWPVDEELGVSETEERIGMCISSYKEFGSDTYLRGSFYLVGVGASTDKWELVCNQQQFEDCGRSLKTEREEIMSVVSKHTDPNAVVANQLPNIVDAILEILNETIN